MVVFVWVEKNKKSSIHKEGRKTNGSAVPPTFLLPFPAYAVLLLQALLRRNVPYVPSYYNIPQSAAHISIKRMILS